MPAQTSITLEQLIDISVSTTISEVFDLAEMQPTHLLFPAAMTGTAVTFQACDSASGTFVQLVDDTGAAISVTVTASKLVSLAAFLDDLFGLRYLKIVSNGAEAADRTLKLYCRPRG